MNGARRVGPAAPERRAPAAWLGPADRLIDLGLDSLLLLQLVVQIEEQFRINLPDEALTAETFESVDSLWTTISDLLDARDDFN